MLKDGETRIIHTGGQDIALSWHLGTTAPAGTPHGAAALCRHDDNAILVSADGTSWDFPGGRAEAREEWEQTLRREVLEEACAVVTVARLLGFVRGECLRGTERGLILVRSIWLADVELRAWDPRFEMRFRRLVPIASAIDEMTARAFRPAWLRAYREGGLRSR